MKDTLKINSTQAAAAFAHPRSRSIVLELAANEQSLQQLARATGMSLNLLHYHVGRLRALGLVVIAREERRPGRPVKRYRAAARRFFVPAGLAAHGAGEALERELRAGLQRDRLRRDDAGAVYFVDDAGAHQVRHVRGLRRQRAFEAWITLSLTARDAENLGEEIKALFARYANHGGGAARRILAYCAFAERAKGAVAGV
jgi:DNA-binding transcriptional ArsR family regulator